MSHVACLQKFSHSSFSRNKHNIKVQKEHHNSALYAAGKCYCRLARTAAAAFNWQRARAWDVVGNNRRGRRVAGQWAGTWYTAHLSPGTHALALTLAGAAGMVPLEMPNETTPCHLNKK